MKEKLLSCYHILLGHSVVYNVHLEGAVLVQHPSLPSYIARVTASVADTSIPEEYDKWS